MKNHCPAQHVPRTSDQTPRLNAVRRIEARAFTPIVSLVAIAGGLAAAGAATSFEGFDYPNGSDVALQDGGSGWAAAWVAKAGNGAIVTEDGLLTYPGVVSTGGKMHFIHLGASGTTTTTYRQLGEALTSGTHYLRFLAQNLDEGRRYFGLGLFNGGTERALLGQASGFGNWTLNHVAGITNASYTNMLVSTVDSSEVALLVLKLELLDGPERVTLWVNPDLAQPETTATAVGGASHMTDYDYVQITRVRIGGGGNSATGGAPTEHYLDELSIGPVSPFAPPSIVWAVAGDTVNLSWPEGCLGWTLQMQAAADGVGHSTVWDDVPGSNLVTATNLPISPTSPAVFFRLRAP